MIDVTYTEHIKIRLKIRKIPEDYPKRIYKDPEQKFYDNIEGTYISIKKLYYNGKERKMMIAYEKKKDNIQIVTIHPISDEKIINRTISGRWTKNE